MRSLFSGLVAAGVFSAQVAMAQQCAQPREKAAFDITGLKSQLMVMALACDAQEKYNAFVVKYRTGLAAQDKVLTGYFSHAFGRRGQAEHDEYVTLLANSQSEANIKLGQNFCQQKVGLFDRVMALTSATDLPAFAADQESVQPITLVACTTPERPTRTAQATTHTRQR